MADRVDQQIGKYHLIKYIKGGGFGEVYLGQHIHLGTLAAIKLLKADLASQREIAQFRAEARTIANLKHPHIIRVWDYDLEGETPFLVMEYAPNGTLKEHRTHQTLLDFAGTPAYAAPEQIENKPGIASD